MKKDKYYNEYKNDDDRGVVIAAMITSFFIFIILSFGMYKYIVYLNENKLIEVPDLHAELYEETVAKYEDSFEIISIDEQISSVYEVGSILSQNIPAGTLVKKGTKIEVITSSNPNNLVMPELEARTLRDATKTLEKYEVKIETEIVESKVIEAGYIIRTVPAFEEKLTMGQTVKLYISSGSLEEVEEADSKNVDEEEIDEDEEENKEAGNKNSVEEKDIKEDKKDSTEKEVPDFSGMTEEEARKLAASLGLKVGVVEYKFGADKTKGTVSWQSVKKDTSVSKVKSINFLIILNEKTIEKDNESNSANSSQTTKPEINNTSNSTDNDKNTQTKVESNANEETPKKLFTVSIAPNFELVSSSYIVEIILQDNTGTRPIYRKQHNVEDFPFTKKFNVEVGGMLAVYVGDKLISEQYVK